jgi:hypothetical protein
MYLGHSLQGIYTVQGVAKINTYPFLLGEFHQTCYFQQMLKMNHSVKDFEKEGAAEFERLLKRIPRVKLKFLKTGWIGKDPGYDLHVQLELDGKVHTLIAEVKANGQPRYAREAILRLKALAARVTPPAIPVFIAPFLSESTRELCAEEGVSFLDFEGNAKLGFDSVYLEISTPNKPASSRREYKSIFKGRSAQVLRALLSSQDRVWKLTELSQISGVSIGHVSNVRASLLDREWVHRDGHGVSLSAPKALLDAWTDAYERPLSEERRFYTSIHGSMLESTLAEFFAALNKTAEIAMASFSAAQWIAPYGRTATQYLYGNESIVPSLTKALRLSSPAKGDNVVMWIPSTTDIYFESRKEANGIRCTSALQTYLDLAQSGERGREAADHLRRNALPWTL